MFDHPAFAGHERVLWHHDPRSGLRAVIAIHNTRLGPAAGGLRRWNYPDEHTALGDVLRLSQGMTYKNALAGIPFGGGKAVILADGPLPAEEPTDELSDQLDAFGDLVESLDGAYVTAEDVGVSVTDLKRVATRSRYVSGIADSCGGDPSPWTAKGVCAGIGVAVDRVWPGRGIEGLRVGVQGLGHVGYTVARALSEAGAVLTVADIDPLKVQRAVEELGATVSAVDEIVSADLDVFVPCALGGILSLEVVPRLRARVVAGAANNQLAAPAVGDALTAAGVLYAPDYVINAGGIVSVAHEYLGSAAPECVGRAVAEIGPRLGEIFARAQREGRSTAQEADLMAQRVLEQAPVQTSADGLPPLGVAQ